MAEDDIHKRKCLEEGILEEIVSGNRWAIRKIEPDLKINSSDLIKDKASFQETGS